MAKRPKAKDADTVTVIVAAGFRHHGEYVRIGDIIEMDRKEAADMLALCMVRRPPREAA
jgi:hypothetical protein